MSFLNKLKVTVSAPKTKDEQYDEARLLFKSHALSASKFSSAIKSLVRLCHDLSAACVKASNDYCEWVTAEGPGGEIGAEARRVLLRAQQYDSITNESLLPKVQPQLKNGNRGHTRLWQQFGHGILRLVHLVASKGTLPFSCLFVFTCAC